MPARKAPVAPLHDLPATVEFTLADGTRLLLNSATAVDLRYSSSERLIVLRAGEIQIESAADPSPDPATGQARPLRVRSSQGAKIQR